MALALEVEILTPTDLAEFYGIAQAVRQLAPTPKDEAARLGLIHLALRRRSKRSARLPDDSLNHAMGKVGGFAKRHAEQGIAPDDARVLALTLLAYAGDLPDPAADADFVLPHDRLGHDHPGTEAVSLLGPCVFLNTSADK